jgi:hypothetical protein
VFRQVETAVVGDGHSSWFRRVFHLNVRAGCFVLSFNKP